MTEVIKGRTHVSFKPMQAIYDLINTEVQDINSVRSAKATPAERQWIWPETPEKNDENYPRVAVVNSTIRFEEYGAGQHLEIERDISGNAEHIVSAKVAILPVTIGVFVKRNQSHSATFYDGSAHTIRNSKQADFLGEKIAKYLEMLRSQYFIPLDMDIRITSVSRSYDDNDFLIAKNINAEIVMKDEWEIDLTDGASTVGIIDTINTDIVVDLYTD